MRILFCAFLVLGSLWVGNRVSAAEYETHLENVVLSSKWNATESFKSTLSSTVNNNWEWLNSEVTIKMVPPEDDYYLSNCELGMIFPGISDDLQLNYNYQWNTAYRISSSRLEYQLALLKKMKIYLNYTTGRKDAAPGHDSQYFYLANSEEVKLDYGIKNFRYTSEMSLKDKNYPAKSYYTSQRQQLVQAITWKPSKQTDYQLKCDEATGDYPFDTSYTRSFWKTTWTIKGDHRFTRDYSYQWDISQMEWDHGWTVKRHDRHLQMKLAASINFVRARANIEYIL